jgi:hypothetical protein
MKQYKYNLEKGSKKFSCPKCNKKTFVRYIDAETAQYTSEEYGRCDRESNCSYHSYPKGGYTIHYEVKNTPKPIASFHNYDLVKESARNYKHNNFVQFLKTIFSESELKKVILKYLIGTSKRWNGATIFWQIDNLERVHAGKVILYTLETGKRYKDTNGKGSIDWVHSYLKRNNELHEFNLNQCLFGLHLINETNSKTIALVESEKTAIIMSVFKPEYTWLSTGSKRGLKYSLLSPIKQYRIVAFPDKGEYNDWLKTASDLNGFGFNITVCNWLEQTSYKTGTDLADVYIFEKLSCNTIIEKVVYSDAEKTIHSIEQNTPEIRELIDVFDLIDTNGNTIRKVTQISPKLGIGFP